MLTRLSDFLLRHEPLTRVLLRLLLLVILAWVALDLHNLALDFSDLADSIDQIQQDISALRESVEADDGSEQSGTNVPAI